MVERLTQKLISAILMLSPLVCAIKTGELKYLLVILPMGIVVVLIHAIEVRK